MQSPALRARDQHHREQIVAAVEGRFCVYLCHLSDSRVLSPRRESPLVWKEPNGTETIIPANQEVPLRGGDLASQGGK